MTTIDRSLKSLVQQDLTYMPGVVLLGPRQVGKTTLARQLGAKLGAVYLDLEQPSDQAKLTNLKAFLSTQADKLVILDEVQVVPDLFMQLRGIIDEQRFAGRKSGQFLLLGSASQKLLHQTTESLAGRVSYRELTGVGVHELDQHAGVEELWLRGGYPESFLAGNEAISFAIRGNIHRALFERDIPQAAGGINGVALRNLLSMLAHVHGEEVNKDKLAKSLGMTSTTVNRYINVFEDLMIFRVLRPWFQNGKKRYSKRPRVYFRDSGMLHFVHGIKDAAALWGHPALGKSWEGFVIEQLCQHLPFGIDAYFYRVGENEIDLVIQDIGKHRIAIEIKPSDAPRVGAGFHKACQDLNPTKQMIVHGGTDSFALGDAITAYSLTDAVAYVRDLFA